MEAWAAGALIWARFQPGDRPWAGLGGAADGASPLAERIRGAFVRRPSPWMRRLALRRFGGKRNRLRGFPAL